MTRVVVDTGPLVALLNRRDRHHAWVRQVLDTVEPPIFTCEAVVSEACFLLGRLAGGQDALFELLANRVVTIDFRLHTEIEAVRGLMRKFATVPMSLAIGDDATLRVHAPSVRGCWPQVYELDARDPIATGRSKNSPSRWPTATVSSANSAPAAWRRCTSRPISGTIARSRDWQRLTSRARSPAVSCVGQRPAISPVV